MAPAAGASGDAMMGFEDRGSARGALSRAVSVIGAEIREQKEHGTRPSVNGGVHAGDSVAPGDPQTAAIGMTDSWRSSDTQGETPAASEPAITAPSPAAASARTAEVREVTVPVMVSAPRAAAAADGINDLDAGLTSWLDNEGDGGDPAIAPLAWAAAAASRREFRGKQRTAAPAAATSLGEPLDAGATLIGAAASAVSPVASAVGANPITDFIRFFVGAGTADNPNAGILFGNGYSYTAYAGACTTGACNGGNGGLIGNGGDGFAGGNGGSA